MKVNIEIECSPLEARAMMGLPDLTPLHDQYIATLSETMRTGVSPELAENVIRSWSSTGEAGMTMWRRLFESGSTG